MFLETFSYQIDEQKKCNLKIIFYFIITTATVGVQQIVVDLSHLDKP